MAVHLQDEANHYQPYRNAKGEQIHFVQDSWCRKLPNGDPDYSDAEVFFRPCGKSECLLTALRAHS